MKRAGQWALWVALTPICFVQEVYLGLSDIPLKEVRAGLRPYWLHRKPNDRRTGK